LNRVVGTLGGWTLSNPGKGNEHQIFPNLKIEKNLGVYIRGSFLLDTASRRLKLLREFYHLRAICSTVLAVFLCLGSFIKVFGHRFDLHPPRTHLWPRGGQGCRISPNSSIAQTFIRKRARLQLNSGFALKGKNGGKSRNAVLFRPKWVPSGAGASILELPAQQERKEMTTSKEELGTLIRNR